MTAQNPAYVMAGQSHGPELFRRATFAGEPGGVVGSGDLAVGAPGGMFVSVAAGECLIPGTIGATQGSYYGLNDAAVNLAIAGAASQSRWDIVVATVADAAYAGGSTDWFLQVITGTPSGSPAVPPTPASSILLAQVLVAPGTLAITGGMVTDDRSFTGGTIGGNPAARMYLNGGFTATAGSWVQNTDLNSVSYEQGGMVSAFSLIAVPEAGVYRCASTFRTDSGLPLTSLGVGIWHNGALYAGNNYPQTGAPTTFGGVGVTYADDVHCGAGDLLGQAVYCSGNNCLSDAGFPQFTSFAVHLVSR